VLCDELFEVDPHGSDITRDKNATNIGSHTQNLRIGNTVGNCLGSMPKIEQPFSASQSTPDVGIEIGISLKSDPQAGLASLSFLRSLETFYHFRGHRMPSLDFLENALLVLHVSLHFRRMFQNESDGP
jgi:hypothetical protein